MTKPTRSNPFQLPRSFCIMLIVSPCFNHAQRLLKNTTTTYYHNILQYFMDLDQWRSMVQPFTPSYHPVPVVDLHIGEGCLGPLRQLAQESGVMICTSRCCDESAAMLEDVFSKPPTCCLFCSASSQITLISPRSFQLSVDETLCKTLARQRYSSKPIVKQTICAC